MSCTCQSHRPQVTLIMLTKCDEGREGGCLKCRNHGIKCDYLFTTLLAELPKPAAVSASNRTHTTLEQSVVSSTPWPIIPHPSSFHPPVHPCGRLLSTTSTLQLGALHHFLDVTYTSLGSPRAHNIIKYSVPPIAGENRYLM